MMSKRILLSLSTHFLRVAKHIHELEPEASFVGLHPQMSKVLTEADLPTINLVDCIDAARHERALANAAHLLQAILGQRTYLDIIAPPVASFLEEYKGSFFYTRLADLCVITEALEYTRPDVIVVHNDVEPLTRIACLWGRVNNCPTLHVPHAIYLENKDRRGLDVHDLVTAEYIAASSPYQAQWYLARAPQTKIVLTGLPQYDKMCNLSPDRERMIRLFGLDPGRPVVCYASSWRQDTNLLGCHDEVENTYTNFLQALKQLPGLQAIIKVHPSAQNQDFHIQAAKEIGVECLVTNQHLEQVLQASDLVVSFGPSNILLEAAHIPWTRLLATDGFADDPEVVKCEPEIPEFVNLITAVLAAPPPDKRAFLDKYLGVRDGQAGRRVALLVQELLCHPDLSVSRSTPAKLSKKPSVPTAPGI